MEEGAPVNLASWPRWPRDAHARPPEVQPLPGSLKRRSAHLTPLIKIAPVSSE